jgi:nitronate monooxygenase
VSSVELAVAVARAGGLGTISAGYLGRPARAARIIDELTDLGSGALAVNILVCVPEHVALIETVASRVRVLDCFWGEPSAAIVDAGHGGGALVSWQVGSAQEAEQAQDVGCDLIIAQGTEAGGHVRGVTPLLELLDDVLDRVTVPVLASGGIGSARRLASVLAAGAAGARVGTRFVSAAESAAHPEYIKALAESEPDDTVMTGAFNVSCPLCPSTHRVLRSALEAAGDAAPDVAVGFVQTREDPLPIEPFSFRPPTRETSGNIGAMALYAGRSVGACRHGQRAADILDELVGGAAELLAAFAPRPSR